MLKCEGGVTCASFKGVGCFNVIDKRELRALTNNTENINAAEIEEDQGWYPECEPS